MSLYTAGEVGIQIRPDTRGFGAELRRKLAKYGDLSLPVEFEPDDGAAYATYQRWRNRDVTVPVNFRTDGSAADGYLRQVKRMREEAEKPIRPTFDLNGVEAKQRAFQKQVALYKEQLKTQQAELDKVSAKVGKLAAAEEKASQRFSKVNEKRTSELQKARQSYADTVDTVNGLNAALDELYKQRKVLTAPKSEEQKAQLQAVRAQADSLRQQIADMKKQRTMLARELKQAEKAYAKLGEDDESRAQQAQRISEQRAQLKQLEDAVGSLSDEYERARAERANLSRGRSAEQKAELEAVRQQIQALEEQRRVAKAAQADAKRNIRALEKQVKAIGSTGEGEAYERAKRNLADARKQEAKYRQTVEKTKDSLKATQKQLRDYTKALKSEEAQAARNARANDEALDKLALMERRAKAAKKALTAMYPMGTEDQRFNSSLTEINRRIKDIKSLEDDIHSGRLQALRDVRSLTNAYKLFEKKIVDVDTNIRELHEPIELRAKLGKVEGVRESLARAQAQLNRERMDVPAEINVTYDKAIGALRGLEQRLKLNPDMDLDDEFAKLKIGADLDEAQRDLKRFKEKNEEFELDVDFKSAIASAHLAYLTRPRTVDIFARVRDTQLGKILNGITYGATGLAGVQNKFNSLVNAFDNLDRSVPRLAMVGTVLSAISAGALNLSGSVLGVGASIVTMSKAALTAPAALMGLGTAFGVLKHVFGDKGGTLSEQVDLSTTKLKDLGKQVDETFYKKARPAIRDTINAISGNLIPGILGVAGAEGQVVSELAKVVRQADMAGWLPNMFAKTSDAVHELSPGLQAALFTLLRLGDYTSQYLPRMTAYVSDLAYQWSNWVDRMRNTGALEEAFENAIEQGGYLKDTIKAVIDIFSGLYKAIAINQNGIEQFSKAVVSVADAVNSVRFQETLTTWARTAVAVKDNVRDSFSTLGDALFTARDAIAQAMLSSGDVINSFVTNLGRVLKGSQSGLREFAQGAATSLSAVFDAIGDNSSVVNELLTMVGKLARTFGTTLASGLRAASPLLTSIAKVAGTVADAFNALPDAVKGGIAVWMTFGRSVTTAMATAKTAMLQNIQQTLQYQKTLAKLGMSADTAKVKMSTLAAAMLKLHGVDVASSFGQVRTAVSEVGTAVESAGSSVSGFKTKLGGLKNSAKSVFSSLVEEFGGLRSILANVAVTGVIAAVTLAVSDYQQKAQATAAANEKLGGSIRSLASDFSNAEESVKSLTESTNEIWSSNQYGKANGISGWWNGLFEKFSSAEDAAKQFGVTSSDLTSAMINGGEAYTRMQERLGLVMEGAIETNRKFENSVNANDEVLNRSKERLNDVVEANKKLVSTFKQVRSEYVKNIKETAALNGVSEETIDRYDSLGVSIRALSTLAGGEQLRLQATTAALQLKNDILERQTNTVLNAHQAESSYQERLESMTGTVQQVNEMVANGQSVWDAQRHSFDLTSEAGRAASSSMDSLIVAANAWMESAGKQGATSEQLKSQYDSLRESLISQATQFTKSEDEAKRYVDQLLATPDSIKTKVELDAAQAKTMLIEYANAMRVLFPTGSADAMYEMVLRLVQDGAKPEEIFDTITKMTSGEYTVVLDANGDKVLVEKDKLQKELLSNGFDIPFDINGMDALDSFNALKEKLEEQNITVKIDDGGTIHLFKDGVEVMKGDVEKNPAKVPVEAEPSAFESTMDELEHRVHPAATIPIDGNADEFDSSVGERAGQVSTAVYTVPIDANPDSFDKAKNARQGQTYATSTIPLSATPDQFDRDKNARSNQTFTLSNIPLGGLPALFDAVLRARSGQTFQSSNIPVEANKSPFDAAIRNLSGRSVATVFVDVVQRITKSITGGGKDDKATGGRANGGRIYGPGTSTSDSIPQWLSNGEMVIKASSVRKLDAKYGSGFLDALNATGSVSRALSANVNSYSARNASQRYAYATGGRVLADGRKIMVNLSPVINVQTPEGKEAGGTYVTQNFEQKIVRSDADLHVASSILYRNAVRTASMVGR